ncbi:sulfur carrier protein ThiS adenylyltransferase ThiF [Desulfogranum japonicum]|uniref:sulfur carrier protein ThiS adenylyltransferase ThiF n=1 Tax=Desulfogranum japonicum TaxID=231447 RepID=UPI0004068C5F|nr:sulfur carrier protein ThiS adenylyltransferase ThiF [Desulfogranum japonicum]
MKIGIAGAGGIGSNVAVSLVRSGIRQIKIVDFDRIEQSNLNRQFYFADQIGKMKIDSLVENLHRIAPTCIVETVASKITQDNIGKIFNDCSIIVEGLDNRQDKKMLLENLGPHKELVVSACGISGHATNRITTRTMGSCCIIGDFTTDCAQAKLYTHKVMLIAAMMSGRIIEYIEENQ